MPPPLLRQEVPSIVGRAGVRARVSAHTHPLYDGRYRIWVYATTSVPAIPESFASGKPTGFCSYDLTLDSLPPKNSAAAWSEPSMSLQLKNASEFPAGYTFAEVGWCGVAASGHTLIRAPLDSIPKPITMLTFANPSSCHNPWPGLRDLPYVQQISESSGALVHIESSSVVVTYYE
ncbi:hypothetical protein H0H92_001203 [Tricholoma furcatifolium]|nr:hypothetical protein H0H92_001203 [Tricholoma furcatifolium]